jgi:hypothetical protein
MRWLFSLLWLLWLFYFLAAIIAFTHINILSGYNDNFGSDEY